MKKLFALWALVAIIALGIAPFAHGADPDRNTISPPTQLVPKETAPGPLQNPLMQRQYPPGCNTHEMVAALLKETYQEIPLLIGVTKGNYLFEIFGTSLEDGNFTFVLTNTDGVACAVDSGTQLNFLLKMIPDMRAEGQSYMP